MTLAELIRMTREDWLDDVSDNPDQNDEDRRWKDTFLARSLARGESVACQGKNGGDLIFDDSTAAITQITLITDTAGYTYDSRITRIEAVIYGDAPLEKKTERELVDEEGEEWRTETGEPTSYIVKGRTIRLFPVPTSGENGEIVYLEVYRLPLASFKTEPEIPEEFHEYLCAYAAYRAYNRRDEDTYNPGKAADALAEFRSVFGEPVEASIRRHHLEQPRSATFQPTGYCR